MPTFKATAYSANQRALLSIISQKQPTTRNELTRISGLSMLTVTKFVAGFIADGIVKESGQMQSTGGRKPQTLCIRPDYAYVLAADIGASLVRIGIVSLNGEVIESIQIERYAGLIPTKGLPPEELCAHFMSLMQKYGPEKLAGIGIGISGLVDEERQKVIFCPNISGYDNFDMSDYLQQHFSVPVYLDTSARCMALAEQRFGAGAGVANPILISLGYSISAGIIINHVLFTGSHGFSGEIGHLPVAGKSEQCTCGNYGCLETNCALLNIFVRIKEKLRQPNVFSLVKNMYDDLEQVTTQDIREALNAGDKVIYQVLTEVGGDIGDVITCLVNILNPDMIILAGGVIECFPQLVMEIERTIRQKALITNQQELQITKSSLGLNCGLIGSATQVINRFFA